MMTKRLWLFCLLMMVLAGCGGSAALRGPSSPEAAQSSPSATKSGDAQGGSASDAPAPPPPAGAAPSMTDGASASLQPAPSTPSSQREPSRERPGLGTEWGETRQSHVHDVSFARADATRPFAVASLFYNDRAGVEALATFHADTAGHAREVETGGGAITVSIRDSSGDPLEALHVGDRTYVVGQSGQRYTIVLENHTGHRFEAVATVDGLDVINGKSGSLDNRGYVLMPFATLEVDGFRQSESAVAAFRFASVSNSYAAQTGSARNVGVIGVAFFGERGDDVIPERELRTRETANPFPQSDPRFAQPPRR